MTSEMAERCGESLASETLNQVHQFEQQQQEQQEHNNDDEQQQQQQPEQNNHEHQQVEDNDEQHEDDKQEIRQLLEHEHEDASLKVSFFVQFLQFFFLV